MDQFTEEAWRAITDLELVREMRRHGPLPKDMKRDDNEFRSTAENKIKALEEFVRARFWDRQKTE